MQKTKGMLQDLREILGLTVSQVADELRLTEEQVIQAEETDDPEYASLFISAFPVNRKILENPDADPFLRWYDQTSPGKRLQRWLLENKVSVGDFARAMDVEPDRVMAFIRDEIEPLTREVGETVEKRTGISRKWLMYGDGRYRGAALPSLVKKQEAAPKQCLFERMAADFEKLPDHKVMTPEEELKRRKALGQQVRDARKGAGLTLQQAADILRITASRMGQMECGVISEKRAAKALGMLEDYTRKAKNRGEGSTVRRGNMISKTCRDYYWGEKIRRIRLAAGLSQTAAGALIGVTHSTVSLMEKGRVTPEAAAELVALMEKQKR